MADDDPRTFIRDITRRSERVFQEHLKQWERLHRWGERQDKRMEAVDRSLEQTAAELGDLRAETRAQREGLFKLIDAIRDLEEGLGGSAA